ncbi:hypothetical protein BGW38_003176, partial [Lunasporangiospora selenospora]
MSLQERLSTLLSERRNADRPEIRAKSSLGLIELVQQLDTVDLDLKKDGKTTTKDDSTWLRAWAGILQGLSDEWPLVREAFQEQLEKALGQSESFRVALTGKSFVDRLLAGLSHLNSGPKENVEVISGLLALSNIPIQRSDGEPTSEISSTLEWESDRVDAIVRILSNGHTEASSSINALKRLTTVFSNEQLVQSLGNISSSITMSSSQINSFIGFSMALLGSMESRRLDQGNDPKSAQVLEKFSVRNWSLAVWLCTQLKIPTVFAGTETLQDSDQSRNTGLEFVKRAGPLLKCIGSLLRIQQVDNTYILHRIIIACASFTNSKDLWNTINPISSAETVSIARENLQTLYITTPWSIPPLSRQEAKLQENMTEASPKILIPGSFSDHVIQILEKELRPSFAHIQAQKVAKRAETVVAQHQEKMRQLLLPNIEGGSAVGKSRALITVVNQNPELTLNQQRQTPLSGDKYQGSSQKFKIAAVGDEPNDEVDQWTATDESRDSDTPTAGSQRQWETNFLEALPVVEWCAQQTIEDLSRVHEVFMILVSPILALIDSLQNRFRIRGLDLLCKFLLQYFDPAPNNSSRRDGVAPQHLDRRTSKVVDARIWIKIFERTGLDQVLARPMVSLLAPLNPTVASKPQNDTQAGLTHDAHQGAEELEVVRAAFRTYLTLILVNTEPSEKPTSAQDRCFPIPSIGESTAIRMSTGGAILTVEKLFLQGILGSLRRANPSREYRTLILEWMRYLVQPVLSQAFLIGQLGPQMNLRLDPESIWNSSSGDRACNGASENTKVMDQDNSSNLDRSDSVETSESPTSDLHNPDREESQSSSKLPSTACMMPPFEGVFGLGSLTIKYLPSLVQYTCEILDFPLPSTPLQERKESLDLAWRASEALNAIMIMSRP